jgi:hypothetical protein
MISLLWACHPTWADALIKLCFSLTCLDGALIVQNDMRCPEVFGERLFLQY